MAFRDDPGGGRGPTITASAPFAHDTTPSVVHHGKRAVSEAEQVKVSRITAVVLAFWPSSAASWRAARTSPSWWRWPSRWPHPANLPTILYSLFWKGFTTRGALWSIYGGLISSIVLIIFSPVISGAKTSILPNVDFAWFPLNNPGLVSIPLAFFLGWLGSMTSKREVNPQKYAEMEVRSLSGAGAERRPWLTEPPAAPRTRASNPRPAAAPV